MRTLKDFLKTTLVGGLMFLLPVAVLLVLLGHAMRLAGKVAAPIAKTLDLEHFIGVSAATVLAVLALVAVSFCAGLVARTQAGRSVSTWFEDSFLGGLPQYRLVKSMAEGLEQVQSAGDLQPVLVNIEDAWQIGYLLEHLGDGWVAVFLPQAPTPMAGNVMYLPEHRIRALPMSMVEAMKIVKRIGVGSSKALHGVDLTLPGNA